MFDWTDEEDSLAGLAAALGASDVLVFRRVENGRYAHVGGLGRGVGWAGIVEIDPHAEPCFARALETGQPHRVDGTEPSRVAGPYYARTGAVVPVDRDVVVVWGSVERSAALAHAAGARLRSESAAAAALVTAVSPAKMLADELEVLHAVQAVTAALTESLHSALQHIAATAADALSCEIAVLTTRVGTASKLGAVGAEPDSLSLSGLVSELFAGLQVPLCVQDARLSPLPSPLSPADGVVAYYVLPLPGSIGGILLLAHTRTHARGFTELCQRLAVQLGDAASVVIQMATLRAGLEDQLHLSSSQARRDPLTNVGNRLAWEEALDQGQSLLDAGRAVTVVSVDLDRLKETNDGHGHSAGDRLLVALAEALRGVLRDGDVLCRLGGDEFGMLIPHARHDPHGPSREVLARLTQAIHHGRSPEGLVQASIGAALALPGERLAGAFHAADLAMYRDKGAVEPGQLNSPVPDSGAGRPR